MAELSTLLGFFESKRKRNHSSIKQITITRYIKRKNFQPIRDNIIIRLLNQKTI